MEDGETLMLAVMPRKEIERLVRRKHNAENIIIEASTWKGNVLILTIPRNDRSPQTARTFEAQALAQIVRDQLGIIVDTWAKDDVHVLVPERGLHTENVRGTTIIVEPLQRFIVVKRKDFDEVLLQ